MPGIIYQGYLDRLRGFVTTRASLAILLVLGRFEKLTKFSRLIATEDLLLERAPFGSTPVAGIYPGCS